MSRIAYSLVLLFSLVVTAQAEPAFDSPKAALDAYFEACASGDYAAAESCYTKSSRELVQAQYKDLPERDPQLLKDAGENLRALKLREEIYSPTRAAFWPEDERVAPLLLRIQDKAEGWRLDYHFMSNYIRLKDGGWSWANPRLFNLWKSRP